MASTANKDWTDNLESKRKNRRYKQILYIIRKEEGISEDRLSRRRKECRREGT